MKTPSKIEREKGYMSEVSRERKSEVKEEQSPCPKHEGLTGVHYVDRAEMWGTRGGGKPNRKAENTEGKSWEMEIRNSKERGERQRKIIGVLMGLNS